MTEPDSGHRVVSDSHFVESVRDFGLTTLDAVKEFVDNSFDADADNIWITVSKSDDDLYMIIEDDGEGIPHSEVAESLAFGGRLPWRTNTTGKYGFGLPSSACCQSSRTEIYTKNTGEDRDAFSYNYIDIEELKETGRLPVTTEKTELPEKIDFELSNDIDHGTVILLRKLTDPQYSSVDGLERNIKEELSESHRNFLYKGRNIHVNGEEIEFSDPLMRMEGSEAVEEVGKADDYGTVEPIEFENIGPDNESATVEITLSKLPIREIMENGLEDKYDIDQANQGFYLIRDERQIAGGRSLQLYTKTAKHNYFRGEIRFPPELDDKFGVQTNKSRFSLDEDLRDQLKDRLSGVISSLGDEIASERSDINTELQKEETGTETISEKIANDTLDQLRPSGYTPSDEELDKQENERKEKIQEIQNDNSLSDEEKTERIENIRDQFQRDKVVNREIAGLTSGHFYEMTHKGNQVDVTINQGHEFYKKIYNKAMEEDPELQVYLDLLLFTLAQAEDQYIDNDDVCRFYDQQRFEWSSIMRAFLRETDSYL